MSRHSPSVSTDHYILYLGGDDFRLSWQFDRYYPGRRLRWPTRGNRDTDRAGAERFAKKWGVKMPTGPKLFPLNAGLVLD